MHHIIEVTHEELSLLITVLEVNRDADHQPEIQAMYDSMLERLRNVYAG
jgi:hypothetical protein